MIIGVSVLGCGEMGVGDVGMHDDRPDLVAMKVVRLQSGKVHIGTDGAATICGTIVRAGRAWIVRETADWAELVTCYNCAYRHPPQGYVQPTSGQDFPLR